MVGRAMMDIEKMQGTSEISQSNGEMATVVGSAPVVTMKNHQKEVIAYTKGHGKLCCTLKGYETCHNMKEVIASIGYDSERDVQNPTGSVFCAHGSGFLVNWDEVENYMHLPSYLSKQRTEKLEVIDAESFYEEEWMSPDEIDAIINKTFYANRGEKSVWKKVKAPRSSFADRMLHTKTVSAGKGLHHLRWNGKIQTRNCLTRG